MVSVYRGLLAFIPVLLLSATNNVMYALQHSPEYWTGYQAAIDNKAVNICDAFGTVVNGFIENGTSAGKVIHCENGYYNAKLDMAKKSQEYAVGYGLGKKDSMIKVFDSIDACKNFSGNNDYDYTPKWRCERGYIDAYYHYQNVKQPGSSAAITEMKQSHAYRVGYTSGFAGLIEFDNNTCGQFQALGKSQICQKGYDAGILSNPMFIHSKSFKYGFEKGKAEVKMDITPDSVGACSVNEGKPLTLAENLCLYGFHVGERTAGHQHR